MTRRTRTFLKQTDAEVIRRIAEDHRLQAEVQVPGPTQITMEQWVYLVRSYQQITIGAKGQIKSVSAFKKSDREENDEWVKWNLQRDRAQ